MLNTIMLVSALSYPGHSPFSKVLIYRLSIPLQVPPAAADDRFEGLLGDIPQPVGGVHVVGPGRPQDLHHADLAYQGILDYHPLPLRVGGFHLSYIGLPF